MNKSDRSSTKGDVSFSYRLILFAFFVTGAFLAFFGSLTLPAAISPRLFLCGMLGTVMLSSASLFGGVLLPTCALASGVFSELIAVSWFSSWTQGIKDYRTLLGSAVLVPVFFLCAFHGMAVSGAVQSALLSGSPSAKLACQREIFAVVFFALAGFAAIFYFT